MNIPKFISVLITKGELANSPIYIQNFERYTFRLFARMNSNGEIKRSIEETKELAIKIADWASGNGAIAKVGDTDWVWWNLSEQSWIRLPFITIGITDPVSFYIESYMENKLIKADIINGNVMREHTRLRLTDKEPVSMDTGKKIGYFRAYHNGYNWDYTWWEVNSNFRNDEVNKEINDIGTEVIFRMFPGGISSLRYYCLEKATKVGDTSYYMYYEGNHCFYVILMRPQQGDYNIYLHCIKK